jgi:hypothetical protein
MKGFDWLLVLFLHIIVAYLIAIFVHVRDILHGHSVD